jgi:hypothetical protein
MSKPACKLFYKTVKFLVVKQEIDIDYIKIKKSL